MSLPPLQEQRRIAAVLNAIQDEIVAQDDLIRALREFKRSAMARLFTYGAGQTPTETKMTEVGEIPVGWRVVPLRELGHAFHGGATPSTKTPEYWDGNIAWVTSAHIDDKLYLEKCAGYITEAGLNSCSTSLVPKGNLLIGTRVGVGKVAINVLDTTISQDLTAMIVDVSQATVAYLAYMIKSDGIQSQILASSRGTTIKGIPRTDLIQIPIPLPPLSEQRRIADNLNAIDSKIAAEEDRTTALQDFFRSMLQQLMTGQIRLLSDEGLPL